LTICCPEVPLHAGGLLSVPPTISTMKSRATLLTLPAWFSSRTTWTAYFWPTLVPLVFQVNVQSGETPMVWPPAVATVGMLDSAAVAMRQAIVSPSGSALGSEDVTPPWTI
jgi:hypothetical protein